MLCLQGSTARAFGAPSIFAKMQSELWGALGAPFIRIFLRWESVWRWKLLHSRFSPKGEEPMVANETKKCAHPVCTCQVTSEKYCSPQCEAMEEIPDIDCKCPHSICKGRTEHAAHA